MLIVRFADGSPHVISNTDMLLENAVWGGLTAATVGVAPSLFPRLEAGA